MQPTQNPIAYPAIPTQTDPVRHLNCVDCGQLFDEPSRFAECKDCADYADSYGELQLDRYLSETEAGDLAETENTRSFGVVATPCTCPACTSVVPVEPVSQILRCAVLYLCRHGWCQGAYYDQTAVCFTPAACLVGAIAMVCYGGPVEAPAQHFNDPGFDDFEAAVAYLDRHLSAEYGSNVYEFNDAKDRNGLQVVGMLLKAADAWDRTNGGAA
jgi:transposase-like protein